MSMPTIPTIDQDINITTNKAANVVLASIGFEELGLSHIINAEGEKIQSYLGTLEGQTVRDDVDIDSLVKLDKAVNNTLDTITKKELLLLMKLQETENVIENNKEDSSTDTANQ